jgi:hypothetical protein
MHVMPTCHFDDAGQRRLALLNDPKLLDRRPSPPPLRTRQNRNLAHVCSFACKSISKLSQARLSPGRRPSPEGYKVNAIAAKATSGGVLVSALITSAATAKQIQSKMKLGTAFLDVDFAIPPRVTMKFVGAKANEKDETPRDLDDLEMACK